MPDGFFRIRTGEVRPVIAQETVTVGTLTIAGVPAPSVTMYDAAGAAVSSITGDAATGYDTAALAAPRVWYLLDTTALGIGFFTLAFTFTAQGTDGTNRIYTPNIEIQIIEVTD